MPKPYRQTFDKVDVATEGFGYALLDGSLYLSGDFGRSWQPRGLPPRTNDVLFLSPSVGLAMSDRTLWRTADGGFRWRPVWQLPADLVAPDTNWLTPGQLEQNYGLDNGPSGLNLLAASADTAWAVFNEGAVCAMPHCSSDTVVSQDGGEQWHLRVAGDLSGRGGTAGPLPVVTAVAASAAGLDAVGFDGTAVTLVPSKGLAQPLLQGMQGVQTAAMSMDEQGGLWLACPGGTLLHEAAPGASFTQVWPALQTSLGVEFVSARQGYGIGLSAGDYLVMATSDRGRSWQVRHSFDALQPSDFAFTRGGVEYLVMTDRYARGRYIQGEVLRTANGGRTWYVVRQVGDASGWIGGVNLQALGTRLVVQGLPRTLLSRDGGANWHALGRLPVTAYDGMPATMFLDPRRGWALFSRTGQFLGTSDGGATWRRIGSLPVSSLAELDFLTVREGWILASQVGSRELILQTNDGGVRWAERSLPDGGALAFYGIPDREISFVSPELGYLDTSSGLYTTSDGGRSWRIAP